MVHAFRSQDGGATSVEYALMAALIAMVIFSAVALLGRNLGDSYDCTASRVAALDDEPGSVTC